MIFSIEHIITLLLGFLQVIIAAILLLSFRSNKHVNVFLIILILIGAAKSLSYGLVHDESDIYTNANINWLRLALVIGIPTTYLYLKTLVLINQKGTLKDVVHFIYPVIWSGVLILQSVYMFIPKNVWYTIRQINISSYLFFYLLITILLIRNFYKNRNQDYNQAKHFNSIKNWVATFFILMVFIETRATLHFCFHLETNTGILFGISETLKVLLLSFLIFKVLTNPEILFGYPKLKKALKNSEIDTESDTGSEINNRIVKINNHYYLKDNPIEDFFKDKNLECLLLLLNNHNRFINLNSLDTLFISEFKTSVPTLKKRRQQSIKGIKLVLSFRLDIPEESIFIEAPHEIDKRIKLIKLNSELLKIT